MRNIRSAIAVLSLLVCLGTTAEAEVGVSIGLHTPEVSLGIAISDYPELVPVPGYPVYYAPRLYANYFFYDGLFWVYQDDFWFASYWYNGPWWYVEPDFVPLFILRVPVFYYMHPPRHFHGWHPRKPPRWGDHWGHDWERRHRDWDRWDHRSVPPPAPLPRYQREYTGRKYPRLEQQQELRKRHYRYQPRDADIREHVQPRVERKDRGSAPPPREVEPRGKGRQEPESRFSRPPERRGEFRPGKAPDSLQKGRQMESPKRSERQWDPRYSRPRKQSGAAGPGPEQRRGVENRRGMSPQRQPAFQDQRRQSGDDRRGRDQSAPGAQEREPRSRDRER